MKGTIKTLVASKGYGFIRGQDNNDYFFHKEDFIGVWVGLIEEVDDSPKNTVKVTFEPIQHAKGPRASKVSLDAS